jgi:arsenate reductase-like glutaredoxin family protein
MVVIYHNPNRLRGRVCNAVNVAQTANIQPVFERCLMVSYVNLRKVLGRCVHFVERRAFVVRCSTFFRDTRREKRLQSGHKRCQTAQNICQWLKSRGETRG